jgi:hypothetical protein
MRRCGLIALAIVVIGLMILSASWASSPAERPALAVTAPSEAALAEALSTEAGMRYRQSRPHHWRQCLLHH